MTIQPISELKNYNNLLDNVKDGSPIYLTKNGEAPIFYLKIENGYGKTLMVKYLMNCRCDTRGTIII